MLRGKKILLGVTGSIAAYKIASLVRALIKAGAEVKVVMTPSALSFVTPLTFSTLSKNPVYSAYIEDEETGEWTNHVDLGKWGDLMIIAPVSANTLAKMTTGECDNLLMAVYLSADCPIMVAPAMDLDMSDHWTTEKNIQTLKDNGVVVCEFGEGELASGLSGKGRMAEPEAIFETIKAHFEPASSLKSKTVIVTAGPTYEPIDPVRFIGNHSSGKMGFALAEELATRGAQVKLVTGPSSLYVSDSGVERFDITTAEEMFKAVEEQFGNADALIMSAAVADYTPKTVFEQKVKKEDVDLTSIELQKTKDILSHFGHQKEGRRVIGFALETENEIENAKKKLQKKNLDMVVLNSLNDKGAGFKTDTNKVTLIFPDRELTLELKAKTEVAKDIVNELEALI
ncbi:MAG: bifunctional phosphopantothenoylcysteine decarboxylase/phosphopantothenate--cysteine ligase CoaBC [Bacteroidetes bacterium]|nr:bifunctional phosphopantothenoylcysteine decarboxylase/phosphopantothenate--cysteine ligase CoaBC [Bacteroidota bacterium]